MNIRDLRYLVALADHCHFGKASDACFISQPALSMQLKKLEEELGVRLLQRTKKAVLLTDAGLEISQRARDILRQTEEIKEIAKLSQDPYCGELRIGIFSNIRPLLIANDCSKALKGLS